MSVRGQFDSQGKLTPSIDSTGRRTERKHHSQGLAAKSFGPGRSGRARRSGQPCLRAHGRGPCVVPRVVRFPKCLVLRRRLHPSAAQVGIGGGTHPVPRFGGSDGSSEPSENSRPGRGDPVQIAGRPVHSVRRWPGARCDSGIEVRSRSFARRIPSTRRVAGVPLRFIDALHSSRRSSGRAPWKS